MTKYLITTFVIFVSFAIAGSTKPLTADRAGLKKILTDTNHFVEEHK